MKESDKLKIEYTDKGLKKAAEGQKLFQLPSNFSYKMMVKINEEIMLKEKRREKRIFIAITITSVAMVMACMTFIIIHTGTTLADIYNKATGLFDSSQILFYLPMLLALPLLFLFNHWLRKKYGYLLKT